MQPYLIKCRYRQEVIKKKIHKEILPNLREEVQLLSLAPSEAAAWITNKFNLIQKKYLQVKKPYELQALFSKQKNSSDTLRYQRYKLELCCGTGDFLLHYAKLEPTTAFIGVDYALPCIERAIVKASQENISNVRFYCGDFKDFLQQDFRGALFDEIMVNFPDPWPKHKHFKRRVLTTESLFLLYKALKENGVLITATDVLSLYQWHLDVLSNFAQFVQKDKNDLSLNKAYEFASNYQQKNLSASKKEYYTLHLKQ